ncbi:MAG: hypothetical protein KDD99_32535, partial [Bacteroidetes bacterium]|nr:hypothetical protein [Bacteroidota bacterium]
MLFDRDNILPPNTDKAYEEKLIKREKAIVSWMYKRYGDKGFVLNHLGMYWAFRVIKIISHLISITLAFAFVFNLFIQVFLPFSLSEIHMQKISQNQLLMVLGLGIASWIIYGSVELLKSLSAEHVFIGYYKPKTDKRKFQLGWILLSASMLSFSIFASYQGGRIIPGVFDSGEKE